MTTVQSDYILCFFVKVTEEVKLQYSAFLLQKCKGQVAPY